MKASHSLLVFLVEIYFACFYQATAAINRALVSSLKKSKIIISCEMKVEKSINIKIKSSNSITRCKGHRPSESCKRGFAPKSWKERQMFLHLYHQIGWLCYLPFFKSSFTTSTCSCLHARWRGVCSFESSDSISAPFSINISARESRPLENKRENYDDFKKIL